MKKLIAILAIALLVLLPAGCASKAPAGTSSQPAESSAPGEKVTLKFVRIGNDQAEADFWKALIQRFNAKYPDITVEYDDAGIGEPMETKLNSMFSAGMGPDIVGHGIMSVAARVEAGNYMSIQKYFDNWEGKDDIMPALLANGTYKGQVYGLAYSSTPYVFAYRKDLFAAAGLDPEKAPATWDELKQYAEKLTVKDAGGAITQSGFSFPKAAGNFVEFDTLVFGNGGRFFDDAGNPTLDTPDKVEVFDFLTGFVNDVTVPYDSKETNPFVNGKAAMTLINNVALTPMLKNADYAGKVGIALPPSNKEPATFCGCNMLFIGSTCGHPDEAFKFIEFALSKDEVLTRAKELSVPVTLNSQVEAFAALDPMNAVRAECVKKGIGMPRTTWAATFQTIRNNMVQQVLYSKASPEQALKDAQEQLMEEINAK